MFCTEYLVEQCVFREKIVLSQTILKIKKTPYNSGFQGFNGGNSTLRRLGSLASETVKFLGVKCPI